MKDHLDDAIDRALWAKACPGLDYDNPEDDSHGTLHEVMAIARSKAWDFITGQVQE